MPASLLLHARRSAASVLLLFLLPAGLVPSHAAAANDDWLYSDDWQFVVAPYVWMLSMDGDATIGGTKSDIDMPFRDILKDLNLIFEGRFEAHKGDWMFYVDPTLAWLESDADVGPIDVDIDTNMSLVLAGAQRTLYRGPRSEGSDRNMKIEAGLGAVYVGLRIEIDLPAPLPDPDFRESWVDAVVTGRLTTELSDDWKWRIGGIAGGFGIGDGSKFSWIAESFLGRRLGENTHVWFGYRAWGIDYETGSGSKEFALDVLLHGPVVGLAYRF